MILRNVVLAIAALLVLLALIGVAVDVGHFPVLVFSLVLLGGILFERQRYGAAGRVPLGPGWAATSERFVDEEGVPVRVWFNASTGERRYVEDDGAPG